MSDVTLIGSCLCGSVSYEIKGDAGQFWHCHCKRCRKATGTGHASNILMAPTNVEWISGNELLNYYKVPDAKRFATVFCKMCGSLMPRVAPDESFALVPAGTLDNDPGVRPEGRIFQDSRAPWSCDTKELTCHETFPSRD